MAWMFPPTPSPTGAHCQTHWSVGARGRVAAAARVAPARRRPGPCRCPGRALTCRLSPSPLSKASTAPAEAAGPARGRRDGRAQRRTEARPARHFNSTQGSAGGAAGANWRPPGPFAARSMASSLHHAARCNSSYGPPDHLRMRKRNCMRCACWRLRTSSERRGAPKASASSILISFPRSTERHPGRRMRSQLPSAWRWGQLGESWRPLALSIEPDRLHSTAQSEAPAEAAWCAQLIRLSDMRIARPPRSCLLGMQAVSRATPAFKKARPCAIPAHGDRPPHPAGASSPPAAAAAAAAWGGRRRRQQRRRGRRRRAFLYHQAGRRGGCAWAVGCREVCAGGGGWGSGFLGRMGSGGGVGGCSGLPTTSPAGLAGWPLSPVMLFPPVSSFLPSPALCDSWLVARAAALAVGWACVPDAATADAAAAAAACLLLPPPPPLLLLPMCRGSAWVLSWRCCCCRAVRLRWRAWVLTWPCLLGTWGTKTLRWQVGGGGVGVGVGCTPRAVSPSVRGCGCAW